MYAMVTSHEIVCGEQGMCCIQQSKVYYLSARCIFDLLELKWWAIAVSSTDSFRNYKKKKKSKLDQITEFETPVLKQNKHQFDKCSDFLK
jgi:hypothetical protein